jgi:hypothetical protein
MGQFGNTLRFVDLDKVTPEIFSSMWEVDAILNISSSTLFKWKADRPIIHFWSGPWYYDWNKYTGKDIWSYDQRNISHIITSSKLSDITTIRCWEAAQSTITGSGSFTGFELETMEFQDATLAKQQGLIDPEVIDYQEIHGSSGDLNSNGYEVAYYTEDENLTNWILLIPRGNFGHVDAEELMFKIFEDILKDEGLNISGSGNDSYFLHPTENTLKKFAGAISRPSWNNMHYADFGITWGFNRELTNRMRSVATGSPANINIKKFDIQDIGSRVGGLFDVTSSIPLNRDEIEAEFERQLFQELEFTTVVTSSLTLAESQSLWSRGHQRMNDTNWTYYGINDPYTASLDSRNPLRDPVGMIRDTPQYRNLTSIINNEMKWDRGMEN